MTHTAPDAVRTEMYNMQHMTFCEFSQWRSIHKCAHACSVESHLDPVNQTALGASSPKTVVKYHLKCIPYLLLRWINLYFMCLLGLDTTKSCLNLVVSILLCK